MQIHKDEDNPCDCGCNRQLKDSDEVIIVTEGEVNFREECIDGLPDGAGRLGIYLKECWERMHPTAKKCNTCNGTGRTKPKQPCDDCEGTGFVNPMVQCFHTDTYCKRGKCAIWDRDGQRCSLLTIAIHTKRL